MRVSTLDQNPETQLHDLHQMAAQRGYAIVQEYTDRISGAKAKRPGLDQMMADARRCRFDVVLVWASDRIARSVKHFLDVLDELNRIGVEYVSFRENIDTAGPLGRAIALSPNLNAASLSNGCAPVCGALAWTVSASAASRWYWTVPLSNKTAARARASERSPKAIAFRRRQSNACSASMPQPPRSMLHDR
jgi:hypothetical protein